VITSAFPLLLVIAVQVAAVARVIAEERLLKAEFADYDEYARTTKALVPCPF